MAISLQRYTAGAWADFGSIIAPLNYTETLKQSIPSVSVSLLHSTDDVAVLTPGTIVRLAFDTTYRYMTVIDGANSPATSLEEYGIHTYVLQEAIAETRNFYTQTRFFSFSKYTLSQFLLRLRQITNGDYTISYDTSGDYSVMTANFRQADYQVSTNSFLENLMKIGSMLGVRLKANYTASTNTLTIFATNLLGTSAVESLGTEQNASQADFKGENYAGKVVLNVENMTSDSFTWLPGNDGVRGFDPEPEDEGASVAASVDKLVVNCLMPIRSASKIRVMGYGKIVTDSLSALVGGDYIVYTMAGVPYTADAGKYVNVDYTQPNTVSYEEYPLVEEKEWQMLDIDDSNSATTHQENTAYYKRGESKIYNLQAIGVLPQNATLRLPFAYYRISGGSPVYIYQQIPVHNSQYCVYASPYLAGQIVQKNALNKERATIYSQSENLVSGKDVINNMKNHINSMNNQDESATFLYTAFSSIPTLGQIYGTKVINTITMEIVNGLYKVQFELGDRIVPKSEYVSQDGGLNLPAVPLDKAFDAFTAYTERIVICTTAAEASAARSAFGASTYFNTYWAEKLHDGLKNGRTSPANQPSEVLIRTGDDPYIYVAARCVTGVMDSTLLISFKSIDNTSIGRYIDKSGGSDVEDFVFLPVPFSDESGKFQRLFFKIMTGSVKSTEANYPAISSGAYTGASNPFMTVEDQTYNHDPAETMNINCQLDLVPYDPYDGITRIYQTFLEESSLMKDHFFEADGYTRYVSVNGTVKEITDVVTTVSSGVATTKVYFTALGIPIDTLKTCIFYRSKDGINETMLVAKCYLRGSGGTYVEFFSAFTK